jgi:hypothetical protein
MTQCEKIMTDEDALFEVWFNIHRHDEWTKLYGGTSMPPGWSEGFKSSMKAGWMARASLHVTYSQSAKGVEQ